MRVAIIGAGISGLTAARELTARGVMVTVFEKSRGVGGRLTSKRLEWGYVDIGAQYYFAQDQRFLEQVMRWQKSNITASWQFSPYTYSEAGLTNSGQCKQGSTKPRYIGIPNMNSLAHDLARNIEVCLSTRIESLEVAEGRWCLVNSEGERSDILYDWVVVSLPAEQSRSLLIGTAIEDQIPAEAHEPCWALALATRGDVPEVIQDIVGDNIVSRVSRLSARPQRELSSKYDDLWMLHFSSNWSKINDKNTSINIPRVGLGWLSTALDHHIAKPLELIYDYKHYWLYGREQCQRKCSSIIADRSTQIAAIGAYVAGGEVEGAYMSALDFVDYLFQ